MSEERYTPDEFARLMALPEQHPDRRRAETSALFQTWSVMLREFEQRSGSPLGDADLEAAGRELERRVARTLDPEPPAAARTTSRPSWTMVLSAWFRGPMLRPVLTTAAVVVVAGVTLWTVTRPPAPRAVRGASEKAVLVMAEPRAVAGGLELNWTPVAGAESYRVVFYGADLKESAHVEGLSEPRLVLRRDALPAGLKAGTDALAEVTALRNGDPMATSRTRAIHLP